MSGSRKIIVGLVIAVAVVGAFLGFTKPEHRFLYQIGFTSACDGGSCN